MKMDRVKNALQSCGKLNRLKSLWRDGHTALGANATIPSVQIVQIMGRAGLDWILIDLEHGAIDAGAASEMIAATSGTPAVPLVRAAAATPWHAKLPLDIGARQPARLPNPRCERFAIHRPASVFGALFMPRRVGEYHCESISTAQMARCLLSERLSASMRSNPLERLLTLRLDLLFIAPGDLAASMGLGGQVDHPEVAAAIKRLEEPIRNRPVILGGVATTPDIADDMIERGYRALVLGFDWSLLQRGITSVVQGIGLNLKLPTTNRSCGRD